MKLIPLSEPQRLSARKPFGEKRLGKRLSGLSHLTAQLAIAGRLLCALGQLAEPKYSQTRDFPILRWRVGLFLDNHPNQHHLENT